MRNTFYVNIVEMFPELNCFLHFRNVLALTVDLLVDTKQDFEEYQKENLFYLTKEILCDFILYCNDRECCYKKMELIEEINSKEFTNVIDSVIYLVHGEHNEFVLNLVSKLEVECNVKRHNSEDIENVVAKWEHEHLVFYNNEEELIDDVEILNGIEFCGEQINKVLRVLMKSSLSDGTEREDSTSIASIFEI
jgi:hypothetical protein